MRMIRMLYGNCLTAWLATPVFLWFAFRGFVNAEWPLYNRMKIDEKIEWYVGSFFTAAIGEDEQALRTGIIFVGLAVILYIESKNPILHYEEKDPTEKNIEKVLRGENDSQRSRTET